MKEIKLEVRMFYFIVLENHTNALTCPGLQRTYQKHSKKISMYKTESSTGIYTSNISRVNRN